MENLELELKTLIVDALKLEDISPAEIDSETPLFGTGLALDSIDALELGALLRKRYGIKIATVTEDVKAHFATIRSLAKFVAAQQAASS